MANPLSKAVTRVLDAMTDRGRETFPEDDPLHYLHVTPLARKNTDPKVVQDLDRRHADLRANPGEVSTVDMSRIEDES